MLSIDSKLDYDLLKKICLTGHSRVPVYEEVEVPMPLVETSAPASPPTPSRVCSILFIFTLWILDFDVL